MARKINEHDTERDIIELSGGSMSVETNRENIRFVVDSLADYAIVRLDPTGTVNAWSAGAEHLEGYTSAEVLGKHFSMFFTPEDKSTGVPDALLAEAQRRGKTDTAGWRVRRDGSRFWGESSVTALRGDTGTLTGFVKIMRDFTERHNEDEAMRHTEEQLRLIISAHVDYAIVGLNPYGIVETWNDGARRLKGYTESEIVGQHLSLFYSPEDRAAGVPTTMLERAREDGHAEYSGWRLCKDGTCFWGDVVVTALWEGDGALLGYVTITRDLSERHAAAAAALRAATSRDAAVEVAARSHQLRAEFIQSISHDLRAPLTAIKGYAFLLRSGGNSSEEQRDEFVRQIEAGSDRLTAMVEDLLAVGRLESGLAALALEPTPLRKSAESAIALLQPILGGRQVHLDIEPELSVQADPAALGRIFINLLGNAAKFAPDNTLVTVAAEINGDRDVEISVIDEGPGIAAEDRESIFERFNRGSGTSVNHSKGNGIGLSMVRDYVELQHGHVWVAESPSGSAKFTFTLAEA